MSRVLYDRWKRDLLSELERDRAFLPAVASGQYEGWVFQAQQEIRLVQESAQVVLGVVADEIVRDGDARRHAHRVLDVEFLHDPTRVSSAPRPSADRTYTFGDGRSGLGVLTTIDARDSEVGCGIHISTVVLQEELQPVVVGIIPDAASNRELVGSVRRRCGGDVVQRLQARRRHSIVARWVDARASWVRDVTERMSPEVDARESFLRLDRESAASRQLSASMQMVVDRCQRTQSLDR